jgi:hypothetical protein
LAALGVFTCILINTEISAQKKYIHNIRPIATNSLAGQPTTLRICMFADSGFESRRNSLSGLTGEVNCKEREEASMGAAGRPKDALLGILGAVGPSDWIRGWSTGDPGGAQIEVPAFGVKLGSLGQSIRVFTVPVRLSGV